MKSVQSLSDLYLQRIVDTTTPWYTYICRSVPWIRRDMKKWQIERIDSNWNSTYANMDAGFNYSPDLIQTYSFMLPELKYITNNN